jgi:glutaminase
MRASSLAIALMANMTRIISTNGKAEKIFKLQSACKVLAIGVAKKRNSIN